MVDSVLGLALGGRRGGIGRALKGGVAIATSTLEAACSPPLTPLRSHFTCRSMTSCLLARGRGIRRSFLTAKRSRSRSSKCCWVCPTIVSSSRWPAAASGTCSPTCPSSRATTSASDDWARRSGVHQASRADLAVLLRQPAAARQHAGPMRPVARDDPAFAAGWPRRTRLLRLAFPPFLGLSAVSAVRR
jgi:hypothetical protein